MLGHIHDYSHYVTPSGQGRTLQIIKKSCREEIPLRRYSELIDYFKTGSHVTWTTLEVSETKDDLKLLILLPSPEL